ncbi:hypothetical protein ES705_50730 [subsurface metagenome]
MDKYVTKDDNWVGIRKIEKANKFVIICMENPGAPYFIVAVNIIKNRKDLPMIWPHRTPSTPQLNTKTKYTVKLIVINKLIILIIT